MRLMWALAFMLSSVAYADTVLRVEGQPAYCGREDISREYRETPEVAMGLGRDRVEGLHLNLLRTRWQGSDKKSLVITTRLQLVSCMRDEEGKRFKYFEQPDDKDWAQAHVIRGLFSGNVYSSVFRRVVFLDSDEADGPVYLSEFVIPAEMLFTKKERKRWERGEKALSTVEVTYHYKNAHSKVRPPFIFENADSRFPGAFALELEIQNDVVKLIKSEGR